MSPPRPKKGASRRVIDVDDAGAVTGISDGDGDEDLEDEPDDADLADDADIADTEDDGDDEEDGPVELPSKLARKAAKKTSSSRSLAVRDPLEVYMREAKRFSLLSREEEHELAVKYVEDGDVAAARRLVESNLRLVVKIAYEYRRAHRNLLDIIQEGNVGLMQAVKKYDPYRGVKLSSYAAWWIRAYILKFILNNHRLVKIGTTQAQRKLFFNLRKERDRLEKLGFAPEPKLLAENLHVTEQEVIEMEKRLAAPDASLDAPMRVGGDDSSPRTRMDFMESEESERPDVQAAKGQFNRMVREKLERFGAALEGREKIIFEDRWLTEDPQTLQQIGDQFGVSRERARQIEKRLMGRLREFLEEEFGSTVDMGALVRE